MSQDACPFLIVLVVSTYRIFFYFFRVLYLDISFPAGREKKFGKKIKKMALARLREYDSLLLGGTVWPSSDMRQTSALVDLSIDFGDLPFSMCLARRLS